MTHIVLFSWIAGVTDEQIRLFAQALDRLAVDVRTIGALRHGRDLAFRSGNADYALVATFPDRTGWDAYQALPQHQAFVKEFVSPIQAHRLTIQFADGDAPR